VCVGAPARAFPGPSESPRGDGDPGRPPSASGTRPRHAPSHAKAQRPLKNGRISVPHIFDSVMPPCGCSGRSAPSLGANSIFAFVGETAVYDRPQQDSPFLACTGSVRMHAVMAPAPRRPWGSKAESSVSGVASPLLQEGLHGRLVLAGFPSPCRSYRPHPVRAEIPFSRPKFRPPRLEFRLAPVLHFHISVRFEFLCSALSGGRRGNGVQ
jgi:hypothetical protein